MFENESKEYARKNTSYYGTDDCYDTDTEKVEQVFKDAAEFGYNKAKEDADKMKSRFLELCNLKDMRIEELEKANEWHYPSKGEYPDNDNDILCQIDFETSEVGYFNEMYNNFFTIDGKELEVKAWKEIVLPELPKESE